MQAIQEDGSKRHLSIFAGSTNSISNEELKKVTISTLNDIIRVLCDHCGPGCFSSIIIQERGLNTSNPVICTRDGIMILSTLDYVSPIQTYIKNFICYVGKRVDSKAHDGTTSAMLLVSMILRNMLESDCDINKLFDFIKSASDGLQSNKVTIDTLVERCKDVDRSVIVSRMAYLQAMVSSKGDRELSKCIAEIYKHTPDVLYGYFTHRASDIETNFKYKVDTPEYQWEEPSIIMSNKHFNHNFNEELFYEKCDLLVVPGELTVDNIWYHAILEYVETLDNPLVILMTGASGEFIQKIHNRDKEVTLVQYADPKMRAIPAPALRGMNIAAGIKEANTLTKIEDLVNYIIHDVKINVTTRRIRIDNLYKTNNNGVHVWYADKDNTDLPNEQLAYNTFIRDVKQYIENLSEQHDSESGYRIEPYVSLLVNMTNGKLPILTVGGLTMQHYEGRTVVQDTLGAVTAGLENGWVVDGNIKLFNSVKNNATYTDVNFLYAIIELLLAIDMHGTDDKAGKRSKELREYVCKDLDKSYSNDVKHMQGEYTDDNLPYLCRYGSNILDYLQSNLSFHSIMPLPIVQPIDIYTEILARLEEIVPIIINSNRVIVPGTVNIKDKDTDNG